MRSIVIIGSIIDGFVFIGPFDTIEEANEFGESSGAEEWRSIKLTSQNDLATEVLTD